MTPAEVNDIANILVLTSIIPTLGYTLTYGIGSPFYRSYLGWVMFGVGFSFTAVLAIVIARRLFGDYPGYHIVAVAGYSIVTLTMWSLWAIVIIERRHRPALEIPLTRKGVFIMAETTPTVPDIWYKAQRVLRTIVQTAIPAFLTFALVLPQIIEALGLPVTSELYGWLIGLAAGVTAVAAAITRIMAIPAVNAFLVKIGLGSVPKSALEPVAAVDGKVIANVVKPDPNAKVTPDADGVG